jgi:asparagine synthase (glutamine-hydrolysing)
LYPYLIIDDIAICGLFLPDVFSFVLYDIGNNIIYIARDPFGIRPLFYGYDDSKNLYFSSEIKQISDIIKQPSQFPPGHFSIIQSQNIIFSYRYFSLPSSLISNPLNVDFNDILLNIYESLYNSVEKRVNNCERNIACLLSGGLDSSLICALVAKITKKPIQTYSIGLQGAEDLKYAKMVSQHIGSIHTEIIVSEQDFLDAIPTVIDRIESYDTTTVRASVGNYLVSKYISTHSDAKVIFNGDGSDELTGGYIYFLNAPSLIDFDFECKRLLQNIHYFDVLRSDRTISTNGLEARTPFLDKTFVSQYLSIPTYIRNPKSDFWKEKIQIDGTITNDYIMEKLLLRYSIYKMDPLLLPHDILWRKKEAFSDGVSSKKKSWYEIIQEDVVNKDIKYDDSIIINPATTTEQKYYRSIFEKKYPNLGNIIPYFWMPKWCDAKDSSARTLKIYE